MTRAKPESPDDSPALKHQSPHYPKRWGGKVPRRVLMTKTARSDIPLPRPLVATAGKEYDCWVNSHGAVAVIVGPYDSLGVKPDEFEVVAWHEPKPPKSHQRDPAAEILAHCREVRSDLVSEMTRCQKTLQTATQERRLINAKARLKGLGYAARALTRMVIKDEHECSKETNAK
jgi:hypothetical protein